MGCERCGTPLGLTSTGKLRKDKRFCSRGASRRRSSTTAGSREALPEIITEIEQAHGHRAGLALRRALHELGLLP